MKATIAEIGISGNLDVTVAQIARRAGMSPALAHHYFGSKNQMFLAAMRHILTIYGAEVRGALAAAGDDPRTRLTALVRASFSAGSFRREAIGAWLNFYVLALTDEEARRLLHVYQRRLHSNLLHILRPLSGEGERLARGIAAMIDGAYLRAALGDSRRDLAAEQVLAYVAAELD